MSVKLTKSSNNYKTKFRFTQSQVKKKLLHSRLKLKSSLIVFMDSDNQKMAIKKEAITKSTMIITMMSTIKKSINTTRRKVRSIHTLSLKAKNSQDLID